MICEEVIVDAVFYGSISHIPLDEFHPSSILKRISQSLGKVPVKRVLHNVFVFERKYAPIDIPAKFVKKLCKKRSKSFGLNKSLFSLLIYFLSDEEFEERFCDTRR